MCIGQLSYPTAGNNNRQETQRPQQWSVLHGWGKSCSNGGNAQKTDNGSAHLAWIHARALGPSVAHKGRGAAGKQRVAVTMSELKCNWSHTLQPKAPKWLGRKALHLKLQCGEGFQERGKKAAMWWQCGKSRKSSESAPCMQLSCKLARSYHVITTCGHS